MADNVNRTGILKFEVDQQDGITELENLKNIIVGLKLEQAQLNKDFKAGTITQKEYAQESVRVENILKKTNIAYNDQQRAILGVKSFTEKLAAELKKNTIPTLAEFRKQAGEAAKNMSVAGVNIGSLTASFKAFLSPGAAVVGILGALAAGYATSARGALDLENATNQLSAAFRIARDSYGDFVFEATQAEDRGIFERLAEGFNRAVFGDKTANRARAVANALEELKKINIEIQRAKGFAKEFEKAAEDGRRVRDNELESIENRLNAIDKVEQNINAAGAVRINLLKEQKERIKDASVNYKFDLEAQMQLAAVSAEIADIEEMINGKLTENIKARQTILNLSRDLAKSQTTTLSTSPTQTTATKNAVQSSVSAITTPDVVQDANLQIETKQTLNEVTKKLDKERTYQEERQAAERYNNHRLYDQLTLQSSLVAAAMIADGVARIAKEGSDLQQAFALLSIGADTAEAIAALTAASEQNPANATSFGTAGILQYAAGIARILGNIATAKSYLSQAAGGGDFLTRGPALLMVGDNPGGVERVTVEPISGKGETKVMSPNLMAMGGGGSLTSMPDGGFITNQFMNQASQSMVLAGLIQQFEKINLEVSVKEITKIQNKVKAKESTGIKGRKNAA